MTGYAAISDVNSYAPQLATSVSSSPNTSQVQEMIDGCAAEINSALGVSGLDVPVTSPSWFVADMVRLNAMGACSMALRAWGPDLEPARSGSKSLEDVYWDAYQARLKDLRAGKGIPVTVPVAEADRAPRSYLTDYDADNSNNTATDEWGDSIVSEPLFSVGKTW